MGLFGGKPKQPAQPGVPGMPPAAPPPKASGAPIPPRFQNVADTMAAGSFSLKDIIAPSYIEVDFNHIKIDDRYYRSLFVTGYPRYVAANWLYSLITYDHPLYVTMFIYPTESKQVLDQLKKKIAEMQATIESDIKAGKVVDPTVQVALDDALSLQAELAKGAERFFQFGLYVTIPADTKEELESVSKELDNTLSSLLIIAKQATLEQEEGFKSTLPLFMDKLQVWRNMDTTSLAMTFPFSTASLTRNEGILYGINQHDGSLIIFDRFTLENSNSVILGKSGGGKSFLVKLESLRLLMMGVDVIILDPENEYKNIAAAVGGEFVEFSSDSAYKINPFDLTTENPEPDELSNKILDLHSLMKVMMGELTPTQDAMLDRALVLTYRNKGITQDPQTFKQPPPLLEDLFKVFIGMESPEAREMADRIEKFVKGSAAGIFNQQSSFDIKNPFTVFGVRDLEENLRPVAMYIILDYIWNRVRTGDRKKRVLIVDEAWYLIKNKDSAAYLKNFAKRARKYKLGMTTITQDVEDFLNTEDGKAIITNSSLQIILKQSTAAVDRISQVFYLTGGEKHFLLSAGVGEGLFFAGQSHVGFKVIASEEERTLIEGAG
jgi:type IV secretory pathway VirB4 component